MSDTYPNHALTLSTPIGPLTVVADGEHLAAIEFGGVGHSRRSSPFLEEAERQLIAYFTGTLSSFRLALAPVGTEFQRDAWRAVAGVPYGRTATYSEIAVSIGRPRAVRAVGAANGANPLPIVVPCHRIVGANGDLTGYAGGLDAKLALLRLEGALLV